MLAAALPLVNQRSILTVLSLFVSVRSTGMCLKLRVIVPRGPLTVTTRALMDMVTPSGMSYSWSLTRVFILTASHTLTRRRAVTTVDR